MKQSTVATIMAIHGVFLFPDVSFAKHDFAQSLLQGPTCGASVSHMCADSMSCGVAMVCIVYE